MGAAARDQRHGCSCKDGLKSPLVFLRKVSLIVSSVEVPYSPIRKRFPMVPSESVLHSKVGLSMVYLLEVVAVGATREAGEPLSRACDRNTQLSLLDPVLSYFSFSLSSGFFRSSCVARGLLLDLSGHIIYILTTTTIIITTTTTTTITTSATTTGTITTTITTTTTTSTTFTMIGR